MFEGWHEFYLMAGSAAAVLIGLIFVVISLMQDRSRSSVLSGSGLYMGPIVLGVSFVLVLSAAALAPDINPRCFAAIAAVVALWGLARGILSTAGIARVISSTGTENMKRNGEYSAICRTTGGSSGIGIR